MNKKQKRASKGARKAKPQYHYFYGSTDEVPLSPQISEGGDTLLGESLVPTDTEEEGMTLNTSNRDLRQLVVSNGGRGLYQLGEAQPLSTYSTNGAHKKKHTDCFAFCLDSVLNVDGIHPVGHITRITIMVSLVMLICTLIMVLNPLAPRSLTGGTHSGRTPSLQVPFPIVDRANFHDEAAGIVRKELFDPSLLFNAGKKNARTGGHFRSNTEVDPFLKVPFPTGAFWTNLVLHPTDDGFSYPIVSYPYAFKWSDSILQASYPAIRRKISSSSIRDSFEPDISFGTSQEIAKRHVTRFDALSVTLRFYTTGSGYWESYVVQGSPYITVKYNDATPILKALSTFQQVMCPFDSDGNYYDGDGDSVDGLLGGRRKLKWGVCTPSNVSPCDTLDWTRTSPVLNPLS
jgi:endoglucanase Acf2